MESKSGFEDIRDIRWLLKEENKAVSNTCGVLLESW